MDKRIFDTGNNLVAPSELKVTGNVTIATTDKYGRALNSSNDLISTGEIKSKVGNVTALNFGERGM